MSKMFHRVTFLSTLMLGFAAGIAASQFSTDSNAQSRSPTQRLPVPSGAQQSAEVLKKMAGTLESIDGRLARIEASLERITKQPSAE